MLSSINEKAVSSLKRSKQQLDQGHTEDALQHATDSIVALSSISISDSTDAASTKLRTLLYNSYLLAGLSCLKLKQYSKSYEYYQQAIALDRQGIQAYRALLELLDVQLPDNGNNTTTDPRLQATLKSLIALTDAKAELQRYTTYVLRYIHQLYYGSPTAVDYKQCKEVIDTWYEHVKGESSAREKLGTQYVQCLELRVVIYYQHSVAEEQRTTQRLYERALNLEKQSITNNAGSAVAKQEKSLKSAGIELQRDTNATINVPPARQQELQQQSERKAVNEWLNKNTEVDDVCKELEAHAGGCYDGCQHVASYIFLHRQCRRLKLAKTDAAYQEQVQTILQTCQHTIKQHTSPTYAHIINNILQLKLHYDTDDQRQSALQSSQYALEPSEDVKPFAVAVANLVQATSDADVQPFHSNHTHQMYNAWQTIQQHCLPLSTTTSTIDESLLALPNNSIVPQCLNRLQLPLPFPAFIYHSVIARICCYEETNYTTALSSARDGLKLLAEYKLVAPLSALAADARGHLELTTGRALAADGLDERLLLKGVDVMKKYTTSDDVAAHHQQYACTELISLLQMLNPPNLDQALQVTDELIALAGGKCYWAVYQKAVILFRRYKLARTAARDPQLLQQGLQHALQAVKADDTNSQYLSVAANIEWQLNQRDAAVKHAQAAVSIDRRNAAAWAVLGHSELQSVANSNGQQAAKIHYLRSLQADPCYEESGVALCDQIYMRGVALISAGSAKQPPPDARSLALAEEVCQRAVEADVRAMWAHLRIARYKRLRGDLPASISSYHAALRCRADLYEVWMELAEAYEILGQNGAAVRSYQRSQQLADTNGVVDPYLQYSMAVAELNNGRQTTAIQRLRLMIQHAGSEDASQQSNDVVAAAGQLLAACLLELARSLRRRCLSVQATAALDEALTHVQSTSSNAQQRDVGGYKLLADLHTEYSYVHPLDNSETVTQHLSSALAAIESAISASKEANVLIRAGFYQHKAIVQWKQALTTNTDNQSLSFDDASDSCRQAIKLQPYDATLWCLLALFETKLAVKQFCLQRAITLDNHCGAAYSALGFMYLGSTDMATQVLSRHCIERAQAETPELSDMFLLQGSYNAVIGGAAYEQAYNCFTSANELQVTPLALMGLTYSAYAVDKHSVAYANAVKLLQVVPDSAHAQSIIGLVLEQRQEYAAALQHFDAALRLHTDSSEATTSRGILQSNRARLVAAIGEHGEAIGVYAELLQSASAGETVDYEFVATLYADMAAVYLSAEELESAIQCYNNAKQSTQMDDRREQLSLHVSKVMLTADQYGAAIAELNVLAQSTNAATAQTASMLLTVAYIRQSQWKQAANCIDKLRVAAVTAEDHVLMSTLNVALALTCQKPGNAWLETVALIHRHPYSDAAWLLLQHVAQATARGDVAARLADMKPSTKFASTASIESAIQSLVVQYDKPITHAANGNGASHAATTSQADLCTLLHMQPPAAAIIKA